MNSPEDRSRGRRIQPIKWAKKFINLHKSIVDVKGYDEPTIYTLVSTLSLSAPAALAESQEPAIVCMFTLVEGASRQQLTFVTCSVLFLQGVSTSKASPSSSRI